MNRKDLQGGPKKTLLLSGFEFLTLGEVFLGVVFHQKMIGGGPKCPTSVLNVENTFFAHKTCGFFYPQNIVFNMENMCEACETITNKFLEENCP